MRFGCELRGKFKIIRRREKDKLQAEVFFRKESIGRFIAMTEENLEKIIGLVILAKTDEGDCRADCFWTRSQRWKQMQKDASADF